jgi:hypothetical protein
LWILCAINCPAPVGLGDLAIVDASDAFYCRTHKVIYSYNEYIKLSIFIPFKFQYTIQSQNKK